MSEGPGVELQHVQPRLFGRIPPSGLIGASGLLLLAAVALLATAHWASGAVTLAVALVLLALYVVAARHLPQAAVGRRAMGGIWRARDELRFAGSSVSAWTGAGGRVLVLQRELRGLARERDSVQYQLGGAVHRDDEKAVASLRERMHELDERIAACANGIQAARSEAEARVSQARVPLASTEIVKPARKA